MTNAPSKRLILAGGSGFLGQALAGYFLNRGFDVVVLSRSPGRRPLLGRVLGWDAQTLGPWREELDGAAALINLTGKSVNCRYGGHNRREILNSRVESTRILGEAMHRCARPPTVWLNASTATIYRHTFGPPWDETGNIAATPEAKDAFSIEVATSWEKAFEECAVPHTRKVVLRAAMALGLGGNSVFPTLCRLVRRGLGGRMGSGCQFVSWIHELDYCRAVDWLLIHQDLSGPVNVASPNPIPNTDMMRILRGVLGIPFGLPATSFMLELGAMLLRTETELVIKSRRVIPDALQRSGFQFRFPQIQGAFEDLCKQKRHRAVSPQLLAIKS